MSDTNGDATHGGTSDDDGTHNEGAHGDGTRSAIPRGQVPAGDVPRVHVVPGTRGEVAVRVWPLPAALPRPRFVALLAHGYGEHTGRYEEVARVLTRLGAAVVGPDHMSHGVSAGERVLIEDFENVVTDLHAAAGLARARHPGLPVVLVGHSMGGLIAARYAQRYGSALAALVLSGPVIGSWGLTERLLAADEIPDTPVGPSSLSRDPSVGAAYAADPLVWHGPMKRPTVEAFARALETVRAAGDVGRLPVLWLHGDDDRLVPLTGSRPGVEALTATLPAVVRIYAGARHEVFHETNRAEVFADLTDFLTTVLAET